MNMTAIGWLAVAGGMAMLNFSYLFDIWVRGSPCIWLGPKSGSLIVVSILAVLAGAWLLSGNRPSPK